MEFATRHFDRWFILSAEYYLVSPDTYLKPYEKTLNSMSALERSEWAGRVYDQILRLTSPYDEITFLSGERYRETLEGLLRDRGNKVFVPMQGMSIGKQLQWLTERNAEPLGQQALKAFYDILMKLESQLGGARMLGECTGKQVWPDRGIYFIYEPGEFRNNSRKERRVVRVGTHMVSRGSKATLWNRLRTHRGHVNGNGNHRASVFRRHVGEAIMQKEGKSARIPSWGQGQTAPREVLSREVVLERKVSEHIRQMAVLWLEVPDEPAPSSDRAYLERNAVALLSEQGKIIDPPSADWLAACRTCPLTDHKASISES